MHGNTTSLIRAIEIGMDTLLVTKGKYTTYRNFVEDDNQEGSMRCNNHAHSSLKNVIERSFGVLKAKWRILKAVPSFKLRRQTHIIIACMSVHNFIRKSKLRNKEFDKCDEDEDYIPRVEPGFVPLREDSVPTRLDAVNMNTVCDSIINSLIAVRER